MSRIKEEDQLDLPFSVTSTEESQNNKISDTSKVLDLQKARSDRDSVSKREVLDKFAEYASKLSW